MQKPSKGYFILGMGLLASSMIITWMFMPVIIGIWMLAVITLIMIVGSVLFRNFMSARHAEYNDDELLKTTAQILAVEDTGISKEGIYYGFIIQLRIHTSASTSFEVTTHQLLLPEEKPAIGTTVSIIYDPYNHQHLKLR